MSIDLVNKYVKEAIGSGVFNKEVEKKLAVYKGELDLDNYFRAVRDIVGASFNLNVERQVKDMIKGEGRKVSTSPAVEKPKEVLVKKEDKFGSILGDVDEPVNATQIKAFEANPESATHGGTGEVTGRGARSKAAVATNSGSTRPAGPGAGNL